MIVTGTIARTAINVRAGAHGPVSGPLHSVFILGFMLAAARLAAYLPLAALAVVAIGALAFIQRMSELADLSSEEPTVMRDEADAPPVARTDYSPGDAGAGTIGVYRLRGALFFGSAASLGSALDRIVIGRRTLIVDFG